MRRSRRLRRRGSRCLRGGDVSLRKGRDWLDHGSYWMCDSPRMSRVVLYWNCVLRLIVSPCAVYIELNTASPNLWLEKRQYVSIDVVPEPLGRSCLLSNSQCCNLCK